MYAIYIMFSREIAQDQKVTSAALHVDLVPTWVGEAKHDFFLNRIIFQEVIVSILGMVILLGYVIMQQKWSLSLTYVEGVAYFRFALHKHTPDQPKSHPPLFLKGWLRACITKTS